MPQGRLSILIGRFRGLLARNLRRTAPEALFLTGALNGLLPCGLVYAAAIGSTATGSLSTGVAFMVLFGLGTWPALVALRPGLRATLKRRKPAPAILHSVAVEWLPATGLPGSTGRGSATRAGTSGAVLRGAADDPEISQAQYDAASGARPKVLIAFDDSGSMDTQVEQQRPVYNPSATYATSVSANRIHLPLIHI